MSLAIYHIFSLNLTSNFTKLVFLQGSRAMKHLCPILKKTSYTLLLALLCNNIIIAQILINEICPANISVIQNSRGDFDDYIEIFNSGNIPINLKGYRISDDADTGKGFTFPEYLLNTTSHLLIFASGSNADAPVHHHEMPVDGLGLWKYKIGSDQVPTDWRETDFDDSQWEEGIGGIGFGDGDDGTVVPITQSVMMRKTFIIQDSASVIDAILMMDFDDGFTAYLNGVEIASQNMWPGKVPWSVFATLAHEAQMYQGLAPDSFRIESSLLKSILRNGTNVLAVQTHNIEPNSSDLSSIPFLIIGVSDSSYNFPPPPVWFNLPLTTIFQANFKLSRDGETISLFDSEDKLINEISYPPLESDHCYSRSSDGSVDWCLNDTPTPLSPNASSRCFIDYNSSPVLTLSSGFYSGSQTLNMISSVSNSEIRYTTNGDDPDALDQIYTAPLTIDSTSVIRAKVFAPGYLPSKTISRSYFINESSTLPVFSIVTDSLGLWDEATGIYSFGSHADTVSPYFGANFWQDWHIPAAIEYFDKSKQIAFRFNAEIEIYGNYSRAKPQKSFEIYLSDRFGMGELNYNLLSDKSYISKYENIILRNAGTDWNIVHFRDALMQRIMKPTYTGYIAAEPIRMFLNGADWGVYAIREKHNQKWIESNFELKKNEYDYLSEEGIYVNVEKGSDTDFWTLYDLATKESPTDSNYYQSINAILDLQNFADYFIAETYYNNGDWIGEWTNNIKLWKSSKPNSKWRYLLFDLDFGLGLKGSVSDNRLELARNPIELSHSSNIFDAVLDNPIFRKYFINRYADLINTIYLPSEINEIMHSFRDSMIHDMKFHFAVWGSDTTGWNSRINTMMSFVNQRPSIVRSMINDQFNLDGQINLSLTTIPANAGRIEINTITPLTYPWTGFYFNGNPVTLTAIPNPGFTFDHWSSAQISNISQEQKIELNFTTDDQITANFSGSHQDAQINISEFNYNSLEGFDAEDWIELNNFSNKTLDISGWSIKDEQDNHTFTFPTGTTIPPNGYLVIVEDTCAFDYLYPSVTNRIGQMGFSLKNSGEEIRLFNYRGEQITHLNYQNNLPWPEEANGQGYTCELQNNAIDLNNPNNWLAGCFGGSPGKAFSPNISTLVNVTGAIKFCEGTNETLEVPFIEHCKYQWIFNQSNVQNADSNILNVTDEGAYQVELEIKTCKGLSEMINLNKVANSKKPLAYGGSRCGPGTIMLMASSDDSLYWYDSTGENYISSGSNFISPKLSETKTYLVRAGNICPSDFVEVSVKIREECESEIAVYPNPSNGNVSLLLQYENLNNGRGLVQVSDIYGKILESFSMDFSEYNSMYNLPVPDLSPGVYTITLHQGDNEYTTKFIRH